MPRKPRVLAAGATYHVVARGNNRQDIFVDGDDRKTFVDLLGGAVTRREWVHLSLCLMSNHFHSIVRTPEPDLSAGMRDVLGRYARHFNVRHGRTDSLFGARFWATLIERDEQLLENVRYVAKNPVRAGLVLNAEDWEWSSYSELLRGTPLTASVDRAGLLTLFHPTPEVAIPSLRDFIAAVDPATDPEGLESRMAPRISVPPPPPWALGSKDRSRNRGG